jgi:hypothetical protein
VSCATVWAELIVRIGIIVIVLEHDWGTRSLSGRSSDIPIEFESSSTTNEVGDECNDYGEADEAEDGEQSRNCTLVLKE